jgi:hypothetical protein
MLEEGRTLQLILWLFCIAAVYFFTDSVRKGKKVSMKTLPGVDAIEEAVGRAAEMGRPVHYSPGYALGGLYNPTMGPAVVAGITILNKAAEETAKRGVRLIVSLSQAEAIPVVEDIVKTQYARAGMEMPPDTVRFISTEQYAYAAGVLSTLLEERPAANLMIGYYWSESLQFAGAGVYIGAMQIGGTPSVSQIPFFVAVCDYTLIGEEVFAAAAYIDPSPPQLGSLLASDAFRMIVIVGSVVAWLAGMAGMQGLVDILRM